MRCYFAAYSFKRRVPFIRRGCHSVGVFRKKSIFAVCTAAFLFPLLHIVYGVGTLFGVIKMPFWRKGLGTGAQERINFVKESVSGKLLENNPERGDTRLNDNGPITLNDGQLRQMQLKELDALLYFKEFCDENGLLFYFCGGCCIGSLRTGGFVPWDDDIDVLCRGTTMKSCMRFGRKIKEPALPLPAHRRYNIYRQYFYDDCRYERHVCQGEPGAP